MTLGICPRCRLPDMMEVECAFSLSTDRTSPQSRSLPQSWLGFALVVAIPLSGARPYGEQAILEQIDQEDSALCGKFGFAATTPKFADCMIDLAGLRRSHLDLLRSYSWL